MLHIQHGPVGPASPSHSGMQGVRPSAIPTQASKLTSVEKERAGVLPLTVKSFGLAVTRSAPAHSNRQITWPIHPPRSQALQPPCVWEGGYPTLGDTSSDHRIWGQRVWNEEHGRPQKVWLLRLKGKCVTESQPVFCSNKASLLTPLVSVLYVGLSGYRIPSLHQAAFHTDSYTWRQHF